MRRLIASSFVSLDGVMQAPGGADEDPTGGFRFGGWMFPYAAEDMDFSAAGFDAPGRDIVLGRRTYEIFEAYWPYQPDDDPTAQSLNAAKKYVASRTLTKVDWHNSELLKGDAADAIRELKQTDGKDLQIIGSADLIQSLQAANLIDEYNVWTFPVVLGDGKRLFEPSASPAAMKLQKSSTSSTGVVMSTYVAAGKVQAGSFAHEHPSDKELARRKKLAQESGR